MKITGNNPYKWLLVSYGLIASQLIILIMFTNYGFNLSNDEMESKVISFSWLYILSPGLMGIFINFKGLINTFNSPSLKIFFKWIVSIVFIVALSLNILIVYSYFVLNAYW